MIGFAICGSFCTIKYALDELALLVNMGNEILPIMSENAYNTDTRFGRCIDIKNSVTDICKKDIIHTIVQAEPIGPYIALEALIICPCTGNTLAKLACGITDTTVCMAAKAHLRCERPLIIALATNDALSANFKNIGTLKNRKNIYFVPMGQDDAEKKPSSLIADFKLLQTTLNFALNGKQYQPFLI